MSRAIDLLYLAKQSQIEILLNEEQLQVRLPRNGRVPEGLLKEIRDNKKQIIDFLSKHKKTNGNRQKLSEIDKTLFNRIPLSFSQERLLFIDWLEGSVKYHIPAVLRLGGKLNPKALEYAFRTIITRHEVLRTVILEDEGNAYQFVQEPAAWEFTQVDGRSYKNDAVALQQYVERLIRLPFDLSKDYMLRAALVEISQDDHVLVITQHHIASDGWSTSILIREVMELYTAFEENRPPQLPALSIQYADYAIWQRQYLKDEVLEKKVVYWKEKLKNVSPLQLPTDFTRPAVQSSKGGIVNFKIDGPVSKALQELSQQAGTTIFMTFLAAFKVLLYRYSGQQDICVGSPISNRTQQELEGLIGFFVNTLALRSEIDPQQSFITLLEQVKVTTLEAYANQEVPFEKVVEVVVKERDMSRSPLFQAMMVLQNAQETKENRFAALQLSREEFEHTTSKFDLTFNITHAESGTQGGVEYCTDLFTEDTIKRLTDHFKELLHSIVQDPQQAIGKLSILQEQETQQLISGFNNTTIDYPAGKNFVQYFEEQVLKTPNAIAVVFEDQQLSYRQFNERSNQLANYLILAGVKPETLVPLCLERSLEMMIAILGVLKAGAAYVPIDPEYPLERITYMLEDTAAHILLTTAQGRSQLPELPALQIILLDSDWTTIAQQPAENLSIDIAPAHLAYLIYTSGSTGRPKGVMIEHKSLINRLNWAQDYYQLTTTDNVLQKTTFCFDVSVWEFLWTMLAGAKLVFAKPSGHKDNNYLKRIIEEQQITLLHFVPSMLESFLLDLEPGECSGLQKVLCSGEALKPSQVKLFTEKLSTATLHNLYGPTEAAIDVTYWSLPAGQIDINSSVPIGRPVANTAIYVLDSFNGLVPIGGIGEIHIGGIQVARGYLNRPELTAEKFVADPFSPGANMYKTGDLGRWLPDGNVAYLGRIDDQVKIRGLRIELGEIETVLLQSGLVSQAVVLAKEDKQGNQRLVAYVVAGNGFDKQACTDWLHNKLPEYMVPAIWVELDSIPVTANGKTNRKALPEPDLGGLASNEYIAPRNPLESKLVAIWQHLLAVPQVGINDNFFELGGHSLLAMRLISAIRKQLELEMEMKELFIHPTIAALSAHLEAQEKGLVFPPVQVVDPRPSIIPLSFSQERLWFIDQMTGTVQYHLPAVLRLKGKLEIPALEHALHTVVKRHEVLRTVIEDEDGQPSQQIKNEEDWTLQFIDGGLYEHEPVALKLLITQLVSQPFNLSTDDMLRANLVSISPMDHLLVVVIHHIAADGWSMSIIVKEVVELYAAYIENRPADLPALPIQYADYAIWQRSNLQGDALANKIGYWKKKLEKVAPLELPTDHPRPAIQSVKGAIKSFRIDTDVSEQLQQLCKKEGTTLFMTLLAAFKILLSRYSGQEDICVGTGTAGRQQEELEGLVGFFINTLALRSSVNSNNSFTELLQDVKNTTLEAYANQELPFEKIVEAVVTERDTSRNPIFQVLFNLQNTPDVPALRLGDVQLSGESYELTTTQFELMFNLKESPIGIQGTVQYCTDLYSEQSITRMIAHFRELLESIVKAPTQQISSLTMLGILEQRQLLSEFNDTASFYPKDRNIVSLFEEQVVKLATKNAFLFQQDAISYQQLNEKANQLAHWLLQQGIQRESLVPVCIERGINMVIGILGILKTGAAYVPVDPDYPADRINYILTDTAAAIIITSEASKQKLPASEGITLLSIDADGAGFCNSPTTNPEIEIVAGQLAYIIYTSGSTGRPKGVMIEHGSLLNYLLNEHTRYINEKKETKATFLHLSYTFDASLTAMFMPLLAGKTSVIGAGEALNVFDDPNLLNYAPYDFIKITPSHLELLQPKMKIGQGKLLAEKLVIGGEALRPGHFETWIESGINAAIINEYGPTEATVGCSTYCFHTIQDQHTIKEVISIGRPIGNTQLYILGKHNNIMPIGVKGEICIGGDGLARGYLNLPELTAEKFIPNPFSQSPGAKLYRTGDTGKWLPDGNIEYLGRIDEQVKIRGYRIEPGEIEHVLMQNDSINQAVVLARPDKQGQHRLVAYLTLHHTFEKDALVEWLGDYLPDYMVPVLWVTLDSFPLTSNGKIDKRALPEPELNAGSAELFTAPVAEIEIQLAEIWKQLLDIDEVGVHDDFFNLGGHSLLAIRLTSAIRKQLGVELAINDVFDHPTIAGIAAHIAVKGNGELLPTIERVDDRPEFIPLSFSQERMWFIDRLEGSVQYHIPTILRLKGAINTGALKQALATIVNRHEALRTIVKELDGQAWQSIMPEGLWQMEEVDGARFKQDPAGLEKYTKQLITQPFDLSKDHMLRAVLIRLDAGEHILVAVLHHIASDGWSMSILVKELVELYQAFEENREPNLPIPLLQYADYAIWQRNLLKGDILQQKIAYWKEKLKDTSQLQLNTDFPRKPIQSNRGATRGFRVNAELTDRLRELNNSQGTTMFMTLLATLKVLLYRFTGQQDVCIGTPVANRSQQELEGLIGFFLNTLALRSDVPGNAIFTSFLQEVKQTTLNAYTNQDVPFEKVVDAVVKERDMSRTPLFQVMFVLQNAPEVPKLLLGETNLSRASFDDNTAKFDLSFTISETPAGLQGAVQYCADLYSEATVQRLIGHYTNLLNSIAQSPRQKINDLSLLTEQDKQQLLTLFNDNRMEPAIQKNMVDMFEAQVIKTPGATALVFDNHQISYSELNVRSNQLARHLINQGISNEAMVAICIERGINMMVGIMGILKAGAVYVPIDPEYPLERITYLLEDTAASLVISSNASSSSLPELDNISIINLDRDWSSIAIQPDENLELNIEPDQLSYIIYTSGSTGRPKGVMVTHGGVVNLVQAQTAYFGIDANEKILQFSNYCFDASVEQIFLALFNGATLVLFRQGLQLDMDRFTAFLHDNAISHLHATPFFLENITAGDYPHLKRVIAGGDLCKPELADRWAGKLDFYNEYGPTETTVTAIEYHAPGQDTGNRTSLPIGKPLANTTVYILDTANNLVPIGGTGEIHIGGAQVARGYLNRAKLTAEKFVADPFTEKESALMYKTGDLGRWLADGNIEYLGRIDEQVKIRGYRIELGEIETVLMQSGLVSQVVVQVKEDAASNKRLVGYVVANYDFDKQKAINFLESKLPDYMVPALWIQLPQLPLNSNGKVDKKALPDPMAEGLSANEFISPRNELETTLAGIWQDLLGVKEVGINDNFFELGGDSIITIQVVSRARRAGYNLQPKDIFIHQTIAKLSTAIAAQAEAATTGEQGILTGTSGLLPIQQMYFGKEQAGISHFNQAVLLKIDKTVMAVILETAVQQLMQQHDALRFTYRQVEGIWEQSYGTKAGQLIIEDISLAPADSIRNVIGELADKYQRSLDIEQGEIARFVLLQTPQTESANRLLVVVHHLAIDGVSWRILLEDLELSVSALLKGMQPAPGSKGTSYRQWFESLKSFGQTKQLLNQREYWEQAVKSYHPLPVDKAADSPVTGNDIVHHGFKLDAGQTKALLQEVPKVYHTQINDILLAALAITLDKITHTGKLVIGLEGHGREHIADGIDTSRTVGWFTSLYPLLLVVGKDHGQTIKSVKEQLRNLPDKGLGFGILKYINKEESLQGGDPWDIIFNYLGQSDNVVGEKKLLAGARESSGASTSELQVISEKLTVNAIISGGQLVVDWGYSSKQFNEATIRQLGSDYINNLELLITHCIQQSATIFTPSDYGLGAEINVEELDVFLDEPFNGKPRKESLSSMYRLSGLQQGMLFHGLYNDEVSAYTEQFGCDLFDVNVPVLISSWKRLLDHHSILRSAFYYDVFAVPVQCVYNDIAIPVTELDYSHMNREEQVAALKACQEEDRLTGFDFTQPPLMRITLIRLTEDRFRMIWTSHHILFDGWSMPILMEEFLTTYGNLVGGKIITATEEDKFEDYIRYIERTGKDQQENFWRHYLQGVEQSTLLPFIGSTAERTKGAGKYKSVNLHLNAELTSQVQNYAQKHRLTVNTVMQGVWSCLLHQYTGNDDIIFGVIVSGRPDDLPGVEKRVGMYINTLPLRSVTSAADNIVGWLQELQQGQVLSRQYQYTPLFEIQGWTGIHGDLFDSLLVFENYPVSKVVAAREWSLKVENVQVKEQTNYPLTVIIGSSAETNIQFSYNAALLEDEVVQGIRNHFEHVLLQVVGNAAASLHDIDLLNEADKDKLLVQFNNTGAAYPKNNIVQLLEQQVEKTPAATALVFGEEKLSYLELNERSNQVANYLIEKGVQPGQPIGLLSLRNTGMIVGMLGILKAGCAYVPFNKEYPAERLQYIVEDAGIQLIVTTSKELLVSSGLAAYETIDISESLQSAITNPGIATSLDDCMYIMYTSGTTGKPKGIEVSNRNVIKLVYDTGEIAIQPDDHVLQWSNYSFDGSTYDIYSALLKGASLHLIEDDWAADAEQLAKLMTEQAITVCFMTTALFNTLIDVNPTALAGLRKILFGGEKVSLPHVSKALSILGKGKIVHVYGPTETTTYATSYPVDEIGEDGIIPIGRPLSNTRLLVLNEKGALSPVGVPGELFIGGDGVSLGYINNKVLTEEKFVANPLTKDPADRFYRSGDLVRWLSDGSIEYIGRIDGQVKIRGYRIEPGEIEAVLMQTGLVKQTIVLAKEDAVGTKRLVAYVVPVNEFDQKAFVQLLSDKLPDYMVPGSWVEMASLPLTPNGKIDRKALPEPDAAGSSTNDFVEPSAGLEQQLADIWKKLLKLQQVSVHDNFFRLGGHSLLAVRVVSAIKKQLAIDLSMKELFLNASIHDLAAYIQRKSNQVLSEKYNYQSLVRIKKGNNGLPLYIVCGGGGTVFKFKEFADMLDDDQEVYGLQQPTELVDFKGFPDTMEGIAATYIQEILIQNPHGPYALSGHCLGGIIAYEMARQLEAMGKEVKVLAMFDTIISEKVRQTRKSLKNLYHIPRAFNRYLEKLKLKIDFEVFLLRKYTRHAIGYKVNKLKSLTTRFNAKTQRDPALEIFKELEQNIIKATDKYRILPCEKELLVFYAKEHYYFWDKDKDVGFKKSILTDHTKGMWNKYVKSITMYEIDGEHSTIFYPDNAKDFARLLQHHLDESRKK